MKKLRLVVLALVLSVAALEAATPVQAVIGNPCVPPTPFPCHCAGYVACATSGFDCADICRL
jgi:hypothetical protein